MSKQTHDEAHDHASDRTLMPPPQGPTYTRDTKDKTHIRVTQETRHMTKHMNMQKSERLQGCENPCHQKHPIQNGTLG